MNADAGGSDVRHRALLEWQALSDALLRGLVHALNNRLTSLSAFAELSAMGEDDFSAARTLPAELERLGRLSAHFRLLASEGESPEALELGAMLDDALALHAHHPRIRPVHYELVREVPHVAVRAPKRPLHRLLLLFIESGAVFAEQRGHAETVLRLHVDEAWVIVHGDGATVTPGITESAAACGALAAQRGDGVEIRLPSLTSLRRQEREARDARDAGAN